MNERVHIDKKGHYEKGVHLPTLRENFLEMVGKAAYMTWPRRDVLTGGGPRKFEEREVEIVRAVNSNRLVVKYRNCEMETDRATVRLKEEAGSCS